MTLALRYAVRSDVGLLREGNEDSAFAGPRLLAIADGMGGHAAGEVASAVAIDALAGLDRQPPDADLVDVLSRAVASANATLHEMSAADPAVEGMGTTLTAMLWSGGRVALCHIGDSRAYLLRHGDFRQITRDHTLVQSLVDDGRLSPEAAAIHPQRSLLLRALDGRGPAEPDFSVHEAKAGDRYLLCSDGLSDVVSEETLHKTLAEFADRDEAVARLIDLAIRGGGPDNITCIVADVIDSTDAPAASQPPVIVGAASSSDGRSQPRADSAAGRAHLLTRLSPPFSDGSPGHAAGPGAAGHRSLAAGADGQRGVLLDSTQAGPGDEEDGDGAGDSGREGRSRRRWPIVTSVLAVLVIVIVGGAFAAWRYTQSQYYVGADRGQVAIFRGVNQNLAGLSLSSVYRRTGIPMAGVPAGDRQQVQAAITASSLEQAQRIVNNIRRGYICERASAALRAWVAHRPKPVHRKVKLKSGKTVVKTIIPPYKPKPKVPSYCASLQGLSG
jgi:serine/threonine protein phosphatase PrpC